MGKWARAADIRISQAYAGRQYDGVQLRPASSSRRRSSARSRRKERRRPNVACALRKLASDTSANRRQCCATGRLQFVLVVCQLVHGAAVYAVTAGWQIIIYILPAHTRQCQLDVLLTYVENSSSPRRNSNRRHHQGVSLRSMRPSSLLPCLHQSRAEQG